jgi:hypothetical protein
MFVPQGHPCQTVFGGPHIAEVWDDHIVIETEMMFVAGNSPVSRQQRREIIYFDTWDTRVLATFTVSDNECLKTFAIERMHSINKYGVQRGRSHIWWDGASDGSEESVREWLLPPAPQIYKET